MFALGFTCVITRRSDLSGHAERPDGSVYNISSAQEYNNLFVAKILLQIMGKSEKLIEFVKIGPGTTGAMPWIRKGLSRTGLEAQVDFLQGLNQTI